MRLSFSFARSTLPLALLAAATPASAQNLRLSGELPSDWLDVAGDFAVNGERVVFATQDRGFSPFDRLWSVPADRSTAPVLLHDGQASGAPAGRFAVTADGQWVVYEIQFQLETSLAAKRPDGSAGHFVSAPLVMGGHVVEFLTSADSQRVVYRADQDADEVFELYSRPLSGPGQVVKLSGALVAGGDVQAGFRIDAGSARAVYRADQDADDVFDLYSAPLDGSAPAVRLNTTRPLADVVPDFALSHDGLSVAYLADPDADDAYELFVAPVDGSAAPLKRSGALVAGGDVLTFAVTADDAHVVYRADQLARGVVELFGVPTFAGASVKLSGPMTSGGDVLDFRLTPDGTRAVFTADRDVDATVELFAVPVSGGAPPLKLHAGLPAGKDVNAFELAPGGARVAFTSNLDVTGIALYTVPIDASAAPVRVSAVPLGAQRRVDSFRFTPDGARLVYTSDEGELGLYELHSAPADGSAAPVKLNERLASGYGALYAYGVTGSGARATYTASQGADTAQVWSVPVAGGPPLRLNEPFRRGARGDVSDVMLSPDGAHAFYTTYRDVYFTDGYAYDLWRVALDEPRRAVRLGGPNRRETSVNLAAISPDGRWAVYTRQASASPSELWLVASDGTGEPVRLSPSGASGASFDRFTSDSSRVVFRSSGLRSAAVDGGGASVVLESGNVLRAEVSPDGARVVYVKILATRYELWSVPAAGGTRVRLDGPLVAGGSVLQNGSTQGKPFEITPDGAHVVYVADQVTDEVAELFCAPLDGSSPAVKVSGPLVSGGDVKVDIFYGPPFVITPDGAEVVYLADQDADEVLELYRAPTLGGGPSTKVSGPLVTGGDVGGNFVSHVYTHSVFQVSDDGQRIVYMADADVDDTIELYGVPRSGGAPVKLNGALAAGADVFDFGLAPGSQYLAYRAFGTSYALFGAPIAGGASVPLGTRLEFTAGYGSSFGLHGFAFTADGAEVVFAARPNDLNTIELYHVALDGSRPAEPVNGPLAPGGDAAAFNDTVQFELAAGRVVYVADQDDDDVFELFETFLGRGARRRK